MGLTRVGLTDLNVERSESECECGWKGVRLNASGSDETECELVLVVVVLMMLVLTSVMAMIAIMALRTKWVRMMIVSIYQACSLRAMNHHRPAGNGAASKNDLPYPRPLNPAPHPPCMPFLAVQVIVPTAPPSATGTATTRTRRGPSQLEAASRAAAKTQAAAGCSARLPARRRWRSRTCRHRAGPRSPSCRASATSTGQACRSPRGCSPSSRPLPTCSVSGPSAELRSSSPSCPAAASPRRCRGRPPAPARRAPCTLVCAPSGRRSSDH
eukprot:9498296-Pyramimonas_sp.AAC.2